MYNFQNLGQNVPSKIYTNKNPELVCYLTVHMAHELSRILWRGGSDEGPLFDTIRGTGGRISETG